MRTSSPKYKIKSELFFKLVAINSGLADLRTVKDVFYGMIKTISKELKDKHTITLPDWGKFVLKVYKSRKHRDVNDRSLVYILPPKTMVKFVPDHKIKKYFYEFGKMDGTSV